MNIFISKPGPSLFALACLLGLSQLAFAQSLSEQRPQSAPAVTVQAELKTASDTQLIVNVAVKNIGASPVYIVTDTKQVDGSDGPYVDVDPTDPSKLICALQLYPPNHFHPFTDNTGVHLVLLAPADSHDEVITLNWPVRPTQPPFSQMTRKQPILAKSIKRIEVRIGALPALGSIAKLVKLKPPHHDMYSGREHIQVGSTKVSLYELQVLTHSNIVELSALS